MATITKELVNGLMETVRNLYLADDIPWVIGYSGGKDSTATLQLVWLAIQALPFEDKKDHSHNKYRYTGRVPSSCTLGTGVS